MFIKSVYAQPINAVVQDPLGGQVTSLGNVFAFMLNLMLGLGWALFFVSVAITLLKIVISAGDVKTLSALKAALTYEIVGVLMLFAVTAYKMIVFNGLGVSSWSVNGVTF